LRLTDRTTETAVDDRSEPTSSATAAADAGSGDTTSATPREEFDIELRPAWSGGTGSLAVADGDFFLAPRFDRVRRVRPDGTRVFEAGLEDGYFASLSPSFRNALHADDSGVYVGADPTDEVDTGSRLYAVDPSSGAERWTYEEPADGRHDEIRAVTAADGVVIYASQSSGSGDEQEPIVRGLDAESGEERWRIRLSESFVNGIAAGGDRLFVQQTFRLLVYQLSTRDRLEERRYSAGFSQFTAAGDTLFVPGETMRALRLPAGDEGWSTPTDREVNTGVGVGGTGVFVGTEAGYVLGYDRETGDELWENRVAGVVGHPPIVADGLVWIATERGDLIAFTETDGDVVYKDEVASGFEFAVQDGILKDDERDTAYEIRRS
jgi:outer membrane protein assembly factor BamB